MSYTVVIAKINIKIRINHQSRNDKHQQSLCFYQLSLQKLYFITQFQLKPRMKTAYKTVI